MPNTLVSLDLETDLPDHKMLPKHQVLNSQPLSIGTLLVPSLQCKIKDNADHAGPSQPLDPLKDATKLALVLWLVSLSKTWLIAQPAKETKDAMEV